MYSSILPLALIIFLALTGGYFSLIETALKESSHGRLEKLSDDGNTVAKSALEILESPSLPLSVAQIGISLTGILAGICSVFNARFLSEQVVFFAGTEIFSLAISVGFTTFIILLVGEFLPKRAAQQMPEEFLLKHYKSFRLIVKIFTPFVTMFSKIAGGVMIILGMNPETSDTVTEDEVKDLIEQGTEDGTFEKSEQVMVDRIFHLSDQTAYSLMTPRTQIVWLDISDELAHNLKIIRENPNTVLPVGNGSLDDCRGIIHTKDLLNVLLAAKNETEIDLTKLIKKPMYVPRTMETFRLVEKFQISGDSEAMVLDEYGGVIGFITLDDIMQEIVGAKDIDNPEETQFSRLDKNSWLVDGLYEIDDFKRRFDIEFLPDEERDHFKTMGGFITSYFGYIPKVGETCEWNGLLFEVKSMDRARIAKIFVKQIGEVKNSK